MSPLPEDLRWQIEESDRLRPRGQDPVDDALEQQARTEAARDRAFDHTPALRAVPAIAVDQPSERERAEHSKARQPSHRREPWTVCECGAWEKGYQHPGHRYGCPRYARNDEPRDAA